MEGMKWPSYVMPIRHDVSEYNVLRLAKEKSRLYRLFKRSFELDPESYLTRSLAHLVWHRFALPFSDEQTPLVDVESSRAERTGRSLRAMMQRGEITLPKIIFVSPYLRTLQTFGGLKKGWPELETVEVKEDERIREQEHGVANLYNDWRVFHALHPEQRRLFEQMGPYWYRYPQGESVPDVRLRNRSFTSTLVRDYAGQGVLVITHHLNILGIRANQERLPAKDFLRLDEEEKPINCGVTLYRGHSELGRNGRLLLEFYNRDLFTSSDLAA